MISVVIPVYNNEKITSCITSLLNQSTKQSYEIIVVDDGSTDQTAQKIEQFPSVILIKQQNKGPAAARNAGAKKAKGEIILFTDSDCIAKKNWIEKMIEPFSDPQVAGVQGAYKTTQASRISRFIQTEIEDRYERMGKHNRIDFIGTYAAGYRKTIFDQNKGFDQSFPMASGEDADLSYRIAQTHKLVFAKDAIVYHSHPEQLTTYLKIKFWRAYWRVRLYSKHKEKIKTDSYTPQTLKVELLGLALIVLGLLSSFFLFPASSLIALGLLFLFGPAVLFSFRYREKSGSVIALLAFPLRDVMFLFGLVCGFLGGRK